MALAALGEWRSRRWAAPPRAAGPDGLESRVLLERVPVEMSEPARRVRPRRSVLGCLGALVVLLLVVFLATELAFRIDDWREGRDADFYLPSQDFSEAMYEPHPYLGVVLRPGYDRAPDPEQTKGYQTHVNALGLRGPETTREKPPGTYRILCLGGSTTFGTGATGDAQTYPAQLQEILNRAAAAGHAPADRTYEVLNCGVSGYNTADSLIDLELRGLELQPDAVIVYHAANDARISQSRDFEPDFSNMRRPPPLREVSALDAFLLRNVRTYARLARGTDPEQQLGKMADWVFVPGYMEKFVSASVWVNDEGLAVFRRNLRNIVAVCRTAGVEVMLETFATADTTSPMQHSMGPFLIRANEEIVALGQEQDVPVCPTAAELSGKPQLFDDWIHLNDGGELAHARVVAEFAAANGLFGLN
jgi:lysophospholipase L1-like esterase